MVLRNIALLTETKHLSERKKEERKTEWDAILQSVSTSCLFHCFFGRPGNTQESTGTQHSLYLNTKGNISAWSLGFRD